MENESKKSLAERLHFDYCDTECINDVYKRYIERFTGTGKTNGCYEAYLKIKEKQDKKELVTDLEYASIPDCGSTAGTAAKGYYTVNFHYNFHNIVFIQKLGRCELLKFEHQFLHYLLEAHCDLYDIDIINIENDFNFYMRDINNYDYRSTANMESFVIDHATNLEKAIIYSLKTLKTKSDKYLDNIGSSIAGYKLDWLLFTPEEYKYIKEYYEADFIHKLMNNLSSRYGHKYNNDKEAVINTILRDKLQYVPFKYPNKKIKLNEFDKFGYVFKKKTPIGNAIIIFDENYSEVLKYQIEPRAITSDADIDLLKSEMKKLTREVALMKAKILSIDITRDIKEIKQNIELVEAEINHVKTKRSEILDLNKK